MFPNNPPLKKIFRRLIPRIICLFGSKFSFGPAHLFHLLKKSCFIIDRKLCQWRHHYIVSTNLLNQRQMCRSNIKADGQLGHSYFISVLSQRSRNSRRDGLLLSGNAFVFLVKNITPALGNIYFLGSNKSYMLPPYPVNRSLNTDCLYSERIRYHV